VVRSKLRGRIQVQELSTWKLLGCLEQLCPLLGLRQQISDYMGAAEYQRRLPVSMSLSDLVEAPSMPDA
jgi:hypothetical protein